MTQEHYFATDPGVASRPRTVRLRLPDMAVDLVTDSGVFAYGKVDRGTNLLLRSVPPPAAGDLLDLGCGYGAIAVAIALRCPGARVWAVDVNRRALGLCRSNAETAGASNVVAVEPGDVPDAIRFAGLYSNPPVRLGKEPLHALLLTWLGRVIPGGTAHLVVQRHLGSDSLAAWLASRGFAVRRTRSRAGYRMLDVQVSAVRPHDEVP